MVDREDRIKSLRNFPPTVVSSYVDENEMVEYKLVFYPETSLFKVHRSDQPEGVDIPLMAISYVDFVSRIKRLKLNPSNNLDRIVLSLAEEWKNISSESREEFFNSIPLNALYLGEGL